MVFLYGGLGRRRGTPQDSVGGSLKKCTKCGGNHDDRVCLKIGDEMEAKTVEMKRQTEEIEHQTTTILFKRKNRSNNKAISSEIKVYASGLNVNKDIEECDPLVPSFSSSFFFLFY